MKDTPQVRVKGEVEWKHWRNQAITRKIPRQKYRGASYIGHGIGWSGGIREIMRGKIEEQCELGKQSSRRALLF